MVGGASKSGRKSLAIVDRKHKSVGSKFGARSEGGAGRCVFDNRRAYGVAWWLITCLPFCSKAVNDDLI